MFVQNLILNCISNAYWRSDFQSNSMIHSSSIRTKMDIHVEASRGMWWVTFKGRIRKTDPRQIHFWDPHSILIYFYRHWKFCLGLELSPSKFLIEIYKILHGFVSWASSLWMAFSTQRQMAHSVAGWAYSNRAIACSRITFCLSFKLLGVMYPSFAWNFVVPCSE